VGIGVPRHDLNYVEVTVVSEERPRRKVLSRHWLRRRARAREREYQLVLTKIEHVSRLEDWAGREVLLSNDLPYWTQSVVAERAKRGRARWLVVAKG
jgi:hypothetical protein